MDSIRESTDSMDSIICEHCQGVIQIPDLRASQDQQKTVTCVTDGPKLKVKKDNGSKNDSNKSDDIYTMINMSMEHANLIRPF